MRINFTKSAAAGACRILLFADGICGPGDQYAPTDKIARREIYQLIRFAKEKLRGPEEGAPKQQERLYSLLKSVHENAEEDGGSIQSAGQAQAQAWSIVRDVLLHQVELLEGEHSLRHNLVARLKDMLSHYEVKGGGGKMPLTPEQIIELEAALNGEAIDADYADPEDEG